MRSMNVGLLAMNWCSYWRRIGELGMNCYEMEPNFTACIICRLYKYKSSQVVV
jgi:hypothetical protein